MKKTIKLGKKTDWASDYNLHAQNRATRMFEDESDTFGMTLVLFTQDEDENDIAWDLGGLLGNGEDYEFALYDDSFRLCGYAYYGDGEENENEEEKPQRYVFRFHAHSWTDLAVYALDEDEAFEKAQELYDSGCFRPENYENMDVEDVTDFMDDLADNER
jgi:hypothetical protein